MAGLNYGNSFKAPKGASKLQKNGVHYMDKANIWVMRHFIEGYYKTIEGKFNTKEDAEKAYKKWCEVNCA
jgi:hypothetical protein